MSTAIAQALHDAHIDADTLAVQKPAISTFAFYDPLDTIDNIPHLTLKAMVLGSMAWAIDALCINKAREVFYDARKSVVESRGEQTTIDDFNEFINSVAELKAGEQYSVDQGFEQNAGKLQALALLTGLRHTWHDQAEEAHAAAKMKYAPKTLGELIASEKVRTVDGEMAVNLELLATHAARGKAERVPLMKEALVKEQQHRFAQQHKDRLHVAPAVLNIISMGEYRNAGEEPSFHQLALEDQIRLITASKQACERSVATLATWRLPAGDYGLHVLPEGYAAIDLFDEVLNSTKFAR